MNIDEKELNILLAEKKHHFKDSNYFLTSILSLTGFIISLCCINYNSLGKINLILLIYATILYLGCFIFSIRGSFYSYINLINDIQTISKEHNFSLVIIKNKNGEFLLSYNKRWHCFLFPFTKIQNSENNYSVIKFAKEILNISNPKILNNISTDISKFSESNKMTKSYKHTFYQLEYNVLDFPKKKKFRYNGVKYQWFSIEKMKETKSIMLKNKETVSFIESNF